MFKPLHLYTNNVTVTEHLNKYPTPMNFNYLWSFGSLTGIFLSIQIITGIFLAMHYTPHIVFAFNSVEHIMRDVNFGWLFRYLHANGASFFFIMVYCHMGKGLYYTSYVYPYSNLWRIGVLIFLAMMATAFMGYVLPWGQMSFWGATVITNLFTAIPFVGESLAQWLWGGYSVDNATLNRFFSIHYLLPFVIVGLVLLHLVNLHIPGSSHPLKIANITDKVNFYPYFFLKDLVGFLTIFGVYIIFVFFWPNMLGHSDNYIEANALSTPSHIVPEWYFLPFYAISRSIPNKLGGVLCMFLAIVILLLLPNVINLQKARVESAFPLNPKIRESFKELFWIFVALILFLGWWGAKPVEDPFILLGQIATGIYFLILGFNFSLFTHFNNYNSGVKLRKIQETSNQRFKGLASKSLIISAYSAILLGPSNYLIDRMYNAVDLPAFSNRGVGISEKEAMVLNHSNGTEVTIDTLPFSKRPRRPPHNPAYDNIRAPGYIPIQIKPLKVPVEMDIETLNPGKISSAALLKQRCDLENGLINTKMDLGEDFDINSDGVWSTIAQPVTFENQLKRGPHQRSMLIRKYTSTEDISQLDNIAQMVVKFNTLPYGFERELLRTAIRKRLLAELKLQPIAELYIHINNVYIKKIMAPEGVHTCTNPIGFIALRLKTNLYKGKYYYPWTMDFLSERGEPSNYPEYFERSLQWQDRPLQPWELIIILIYVGMLVVLTLYGGQVNHGIWSEWLWKYF